MRAARAGAVGSSPWLSGTANVEQAFALLHSASPASLGGTFCSACLPSCHCCHFVADDELEAAPPGSGSDAEEEGEEGNAGAGGGGGSSDSDSEGGGGGRQQQRDAGFLEGGKSASFAKAFAMILEGSGKKAAEAARPTAAGGAAVAPILATSKSIAKRKAEDAEEQQADREAKKLRQEMKKRGHVVRWRGWCGAGPKMHGMRSLEGVAISSLAVWLVRVW